MKKRPTGSGQSEGGLDYTPSRVRLTPPRTPRVYTDDEIVELARQLGREAAREGQADEPEGHAKKS